jgi:hypothetical protein
MCSKHSCDPLHYVLIDFFAIVLIIFWYNSCVDMQIIIFFLKFVLNLTFIGSFRYLE